VPLIVKLSSDAFPRVHKSTATALHTLGAELPKEALCCHLCSFITGYVKKLGKYFNESIDIMRDIGGIMEQKYRWQPFYPSRTSTGYYSNSRP